MASNIVLPATVEGRDLRATRRSPKITTNVKGKTSTTRLSRSDSKKMKSIPKSSRGVRTRASTPYLDVPVVKTTTTTKAKLLQSNKKKQSLLKGKGGKKMESPKPNSIIDSPKAKDSDSIPINVTPKKNPPELDVPNQDLKESPSVIQNILKEGFDSKSTSILPVLWPSPSQSKEIPIYQSNQKIKTSSNAIESKKSKPISNSSLKAASEDKMIPDSRISTPSNSPEKNKLSQMENSFDTHLSDSPAENVRDTKMLPRKALFPVKLSLDEFSQMEKENEEVPYISKSPFLTQTLRKMPPSVNSSPIKNTFDDSYVERTPLPQLKTGANRTYPENGQSSTQREKKVGFSDETQCFSSPPPSSPLKIVGPLKSILKMTEGRSAATLDSSKENDFTVSPFWVKGSIVQLPMGSSDNLLLLERASNDLLDAKFANKFEAYTSMNNIIKMNTLADIVSWFSPKCVSLFNAIYRDISESADYGNPFSSRTMIQALKLASFFFANEQMNEKLPIPTTRKFVMLCCTLIESTEISKGLASMLLQLFRDQRLSPKIVSPKIGEFILQSILNMRTFSSVSLTIERINTLCEYIKSNFVMLQKNLNSWLGFLFINLLDTTSILAARIVTAASNLLSEICKRFMRNKEFKFSLFYFIHQPLSFALNSMDSQSQTQIDPDSLKNDARLLDYLCDKLKVMSKRNLTNVVTDIWFHMTLLLSRTDPNEGLENWDGIAMWISVYKECYDNADKSSKISVIKAWRSVIYSCLQSLDFHGNFVIEKKRFALIKFLFTSGLVKNEADPNVLSYLHSLFITILYTYYNVVSLYYKSNHMLMDEIWTSVIEPVLSDYYFKKETLKQSPISIMGVEILNGLLSKNYGMKKADPVRCLRPDLVGVQELNPLPSHWVCQNYKSLYKLHIAAFQIEGLHTSQKLALLNNYINCLRSSTSSRAIKQNTDKKLDICSVIPSLISEFFENIELSAPIDFVFDILVRLNDALGIGALIDDSDVKNPCYTIISKLLSIENFPSKKLIEVCKFISNILGYKLQLVFYHDLLRLDNTDLNSFVIQKVKERKFGNMTLLEYEYLGLIMQEPCAVDIGDSVISMVINQIMNPIAEKNPMKAIELLKLGSWNSRLSTYAIFLILDYKSKLGVPRNLLLPSIIKFSISELISQNVDGCIDFFEELCVPSRKGQMLSLAPVIVKGVHSIQNRFTDVKYNKRIQQLCSTISTLISDDDSLLNLFSGLFKEDELSLQKGTDPSVESDKATESHSSDIIATPSTSAMVDPLNDKNSSMELIMENEETSGSSIGGSENFQNESIENNNLSTGKNDTVAQLHTVSDTQIIHEPELKELNSNRLESESGDSSPQLSEAKEIDMSISKEDKGVTSQNSHLELNAAIDSVIPETNKIRNSGKRSFEEDTQEVESAKKLKTDKEKNATGQSPPFIADLLDIDVELSSLSSLSDVEDTLEDLELAKEYELDISNNKSTDSSKIDNSIAGDERHENSNFDKGQLRGTNVGEVRSEGQLRESAVVDSTHICEKLVFEDNVSNQVLRDDVLMGTIRSLIKEIDVSALADNSKDELIDDLLGLIMRLRGLK